LRERFGYSIELFQRIAAHLRLAASQEQWAARFRFLCIGILLLLVFVVSLWEPFGLLGGLLFGKIEFTARVGNMLAAEFVSGYSSVGINCGVSLFAIWSALVAGALMLQTIFRLEPRDAWRRIRAGVNLAGYPSLTIRSGRFEEGSNNPLHLIGGPGSVTVATNSAIVTERFSLAHRELAAGTHLLLPFEKIYAVMDLRPAVEQSQVNTLTKDGIPIRAEFEIEFRLSGDSEPVTPPLAISVLIQRALLEWLAALLRRIGARTRADWVRRNIEILAPVPAASPDAPRQSPFPFSAAMARRAAFAPSVQYREDGESIQTTPVSLPPRIAAGELRGALNRHVLDRLFEPEDAAPDSPLPLNQTSRWIIQTQIFNNVNRAIRNVVGYEVTRLAIGRIVLDEVLDQIEPALRQRIEDQRGKTWSAEWRQRANALTQIAHVEKNRLQQQARAEAQFRALQSITEAIPPGTPPQELRRILTLRILQALEALSTGSAMPIPTQVMQAMDLLRRFLA